jgi:hypothetical protein
LRPSPIKNPRTMADTTNYKDTTKITAKDICELLCTISERTAQQYYTDIKNQFHIKIVLYSHFKAYFKI